MKEKIYMAGQTGSRVGKNVYEFLEASCLAAVSGYAIYKSLDRSVWYEWVLLFAGIFIVLRAFQLYWRHFSK